jgi:CheY-like chemotaxis protein
MTHKLNCVLLVDDNEADNYFHERVLKKSGLVGIVATAINGQEALEYLQASRNPGSSDNKPMQPDLILLDINMPLMNGWEFLNEYANLGDEPGKKQVIVMLTTSLNPDDRTQAEAILGPGCFYFKPLTQEIFAAILDRHFNHHENPVS